ncbi:MAG: hypothetical protein SF187_02140 [Deltaproteobacteria bacterium]|nr:hypothetical protein [Deltaproteobacteria bacterium]
MSRLPLLLAFAATACAPEVGEPAWLVARPRILAVKSVPAEVRPGDAVTLDLLLAGAPPHVAAQSQWSVCKTAKPPIEDNVVARACVDEPGTPAAVGPSVSIAMPADACRVFGPDPPGPGLRARDPDVTGGYYQPVRVQAAGEVAFAMVRVFCNLPQASRAVAQAYREQYRLNQAPVLGPLLIDGAAARAVPGGSLHRLSVPAAGREGYVRFDALAGALQPAVESLRATWFVTGGSLEDDDDDNDANQGQADVRWTAPAGGAPVEIFVVLRDSRSGVDFRTAVVDVLP